MNLDQFQKQCQTNKFASLYLFIGSEKYLHQEAITTLKSTAIDESALVFNFAEISVAAEGMAEVLTLAEQYPMFGGRRVVIARDFEKISDDQAEALKSYLKNPQPSTTLVFQTETLDKRRNVATALLKSCEVVELNPLKDREAIDWANAYIRRAGYQMAGNTVGLLIGLTGTDLFTIRNELEKLIAGVGRPGLISAAEVERLVSRSREHSNFELGDAILAGESKRTLRLLHRQLADQGEPIMLLAIIARTFRQILIAKELMQEKRPPDEIAREIGVPPFRIAEFLTQARQWEIDKVLRAIRRIAKVDNDLKNSLGKPDLQLEFLICELIN